jgi:pimeloyl-ACP methyl ester carboxylesterase
VELPDGTTVALSHVETNGIRMHVAQAGSGPAVLLLHGFPELWWSWRHQIGPLAAAGYRVIAPDLRGYGRTDAPPEPADYAVDKLAADVSGLLDALGEDDAVIVGHDWGANLAWSYALLEPQRARAVAGLSVPLVPHSPQPPLEIFRQFMGEDFYIVWFQQPGVADAALAKDVRRTLLARDVWTPKWAARDDVDPLPPWKTEEEQAYYVEEYERTGFTGGLSWYRAMDLSWKVMAPHADKPIEQPALFIGGADDPFKNLAPVSVMESRAPRLEQHEIEGAGHWIQQHAPQEVNEILLGWLTRL